MTGIYKQQVIVTVPRRISVLPEYNSLDRRASMRAIFGNSDGSWLMFFLLSRAFHDDGPCYQRYRGPPGPSVARIF